MVRKETRVSYLVQQEGYRFQRCAAQQDPANWAFECVSSVLQAPSTIFHSMYHIYIQEVSAFSSHASSALARLT